MDDDTKCLYFTRKKEEQKEDYSSCVFLANKRRQTMAISSLWPDDKAEIYGTCSAYIVAMTSTNLFEVVKEKKESVITGTIVKGSFSWLDEISKGVRFTVIYSVPEDYKILNHIQFEEIVEEKKNKSVKMTLK